MAAMSTAQGDERRTLRAALKKLSADVVAPLLAALDSESPALLPFAADLGSRWEILDTGITVKLYPSCAATHPALDALLDLKRRDPFGPDGVQRIE